MKTSIKAIFVCLIFLLLKSTVLGQAQGSENKRQSNELNVRVGLPNFFAKALKGDSVKVAYLGGSITAQAGWRVYSLNWFKQRFPKAVFSEINAAIGGTGSNFGVFRLHEHVLKFKPDLVFVEFVVNDDGASEEKITRSMEGIVRQIWQQNAFTDICFIYTIKIPFLEIEQKGQLPPSAIVMEKVADKYNIPTINFGFEVAELVANNQLIFKDKSKEVNGVKVFSPDGVHPYTETGHAEYHKVFMRSFEAMLPSKPGRTKKHISGKPLAMNYFANTQMVGLQDVRLSDHWEIIRTKDEPFFTSFGKYLETFGRASQSGESLAVRFKGQAIGVYDILGPDVGRVIVEIDGTVRDTISRFDPYCTYRRMNYFMIDNLENKEHEVVFRLLAEPFDKAAILSKIGNVMKDPDEYKQNNWHVGKILIDGAILP